MAKFPETPILRAGGWSCRNGAISSGVAVHRSTRDRRVGSGGPFLVIFSMETDEIPSISWDVHPTGKRFSQSQEFAAKNGNSWVNKDWVQRWMHQTITIFIGKMMKHHHEIWGGALFSVTPWNLWQLWQGTWGREPLDMGLSKHWDVPSITILRWVNTSKTDQMCGRIGLILFLCMG